MTHDEIAAYCARWKESATYQAFWQRHMRCECCGNWSAAPHHIRTRGSGGDDDPRNLLALCTTHHNEIHQLGNREFSERYPVVAAKIAAALDRSRAMASA